MSAELMLESTQPSLLIIEKRTRQDIVIGVPHHAPAGVPRLRCPEPRPSDENAGFIGRHLAEQLDCCSVIACNYTIDANKYLRSDYTMQIAAWNPVVLIEIHGHGKTKSKYDVEISCGAAELTAYSETLAAALLNKLADDAELAEVSVCGRFADLYFKATETLTITDARWTSYHIELSPRLRKPETAITGNPSAFAYRFCDHLAAVVKLMGHIRSGSI
jgi:hypothetical protein